MNATLKRQLLKLKEIYYKGSEYGTYKGKWCRRKLHKVIISYRGYIIIWGSSRPIQIHYTAKGEPYFRYEGSRLYLHDFMSTHNVLHGPHPWGGREFDGYKGDSFFSGVVIKLGDKDGRFQDECLRAYTYCS